MRFVWVGQGSPFYRFKKIELYGIRDGDHTVLLATPSENIVKSFEIALRNKISK